MNDLVFFDEGNLEKQEIMRDKAIAVYGVGEDCCAILEELKKYNGLKIYVTDRSENGNIGKNFYGYNVCELSDVLSQVTYIVIASEKYHISMEARLERIVKDKKDIKILSPFKMVEYFPKEQLIINKYENPSNEFSSEEELIEQKKNRNQYFDKIQAYVAEAMQYTPLFKLIEIETYNRCNGVCEFCPVNRNVDTRKEHYMSEELFHKIVGELECMEYSGRVSLFSNNEPLLDARVFEFSRYLREHLPKARIHMFTNGTLFTLGKFLELIPELDELIIDNYNQELHLIKPVKEIYEYCEVHPELKEKVSIVLRKPKELLTSRGGAAPNRKKVAVYNGVACSFPFQQMIVRPTGEVSLCCNDALGKYTMGDLSEQSILDVWYGPKFTEIREKIARGREHVGHCQYCDTFSLYL